MTAAYATSQFDLFPASEQSCNQRTGVQIISPSRIIVDWAKRKWPNNAPKMLAFLMRVSDRAAYYYVNHKRQIPTRGFFALLDSSYGPEVMDALYGADPNHWWVSRKERMDTLAVGLEAMQNEIDELKRRRP